MGRSRSSPTDGLLAIVGAVLLLTSPTGRRLLFDDSSGIGGVAFLLIATLSMAAAPTFTSRTLAVLGALAALSDTGNAGVVVQLVLIMAMLFWIYGLMFRGGR